MKRTVVSSIVATMCAVVLLASSAGCKNDASASKDVDHSAHAIGDHSCASCGMVVGEQSGPRGQVVHRDGTREYFCSVSDMLTYMQAPSRHGRIMASYVETMDPTADPSVFDTSKRAWVSTDQAAYVLGVDKPRVMGTPVLVYPTSQQAQSIAHKHSGTVVDWTQLRKQLQHK